MAHNYLKHVRRSVKTGMPPGTLVPVGKAYSTHTAISLIAYGAGEITKTQNASIEDVKRALSSGRNVWVQVHGLQEVDKIRALGELVGLHPLAMEDIVNTEHRPKIEEFGDHLLIILKKLCTDETSFFSEQVSLVLGTSYLITFFERESDFLMPVEVRFENRGGKLIQGGTDYLAYAVIDLIVDNYYLILESYSLAIEELETSLVSSPDVEHLEKIQALKRTIIKARKSAWPLREIIGRLEKIDGDLISDSTTPYLRDVYDHVIQVIENLESYRDLLSGLLDIYLSSTSNKLNEVMKVLTIISTIFIPLSFIAGLYGMNFVNMPELSWTFGYPFALIAMCAVSAGMIQYFRKKSWI